MTYKHLLKFLLNLDDSKLEDDVTVMINGEAHHVWTATEVATEDDQGILDEGHAVLIART